jgi:hypothetical protein
LSGADPIPLLAAREIGFKGVEIVKRLFAMLATLAATFLAAGANAKW